MEYSALICVTSGEEMEDHGSRPVDLMLPWVLVLRDEAQTGTASKPHERITQTVEFLRTRMAIQVLLRLVFYPYLCALQCDPYTASGRQEIPHIITPQFFDHVNMNGNLIFPRQIHVCSIVFLVAI
jgi:hypothetical protein